MVERNAGLIVEVTDGDTHGYRGNLFYDLAKNAVIRLAYAMAGDLHAHRVTALAITPGFLRSDLPADVHQQVAELRHALQPLGEIGREDARFAKEPEAAGVVGRRGSQPARRHVIAEPYRTRAVRESGTAARNSATSRAQAARPGRTSTPADSWPENRRLRLRLPPNQA